jgi:site-specific DNA recombinase
VVQARLAGNAAQRKAGGRAAQPSLLAGMLFDGDGNRMTPSHAVKSGDRAARRPSTPVVFCLF